MGLPLNQVMTFLQGPSLLYNARSPRTVVATRFSTMCVQVRVCVAQAYGSTFQLTGVLGLVAIIYALYQLRSGAGRLCKTHAGGQG